MRNLNVFHTPQQQGYRDGGVENTEFFARNFKEIGLKFGLRL